MRLVILFICSLIISSQSHAWEEPARGTQLRKDLMNAARPHAEEMLGVPVQFVVDSLRVDGNIAFAALSPQRPNGVPIRFENTLFPHLGVEQDHMDGFALQAFFKKRNGIWRVMHHEIGATDVWYHSALFCIKYAPVIPELCKKRQ